MDKTPAAPDNGINDRASLAISRAKAVLSPVNSIVTRLGLPEISKRLSVVMDIFGGF